LSWSHGDDEIISTEQAIEWFGLDAVGKGAARFDFAKLESLNGQYIRETDDGRLAELVIAHLRETHDGGLVDDALERIQNGMSGLKERAKNINELAESALFYALPRPLVYNEKASALLNDDTRAHLSGFRDGLSALDDWSEDTLQTVAKEFVEERDLKLGKVAQPLRAALTGTNVSPSIFEVMAVLGREESLARIDDAL